MAGERRNGRLGDYILLQSGGTPSKSRPDYWSGDLPWVSAKDMKSYWIDDTEDHLSEAGANAATRVVEGGATLLLVRGMTLHNDVPICRVRRRSAFNQDVKAVLPRAGTDPEFIPYLLLGNKTRLLSIVDSAGHGTGRINSDTLLDLPVNVPPLGEQRAIACILGSLDDKIELNRRMNRTLEEMARAIFKSWFIDFDPVRAKAAVRRQHPKWTDDQVSRAACPKLKPEIARLFPDSFEDSELGEIPKGWAVCTVDEAFELTMGQSPPGETYNETGDGLPFYQGRADFGFRFPKRRVFCTAPTRLAKRGDTLVSVRAPVGDINMASEDCAIGRGLGSIRHKSGSRSFTYYSMRALESQFEIFEAEGTVFGSISKKDFHRLAFVVPPESLVAQFEKLSCPFDDAIERNEQESGTLTALRDTLLPKLISGELRVPDAERIAARCA